MTAILLFFCVLTVYVFTGPPGIITGDSGEFITSAVTLGISHPSGYPLHCLLGKIFSLINLSNFAWRVVFLSMVFSSLASVFVYLLLKEITGKNMLPLAGAVIYAFSPLVWSQSIICKIYSLNAFFTVLILYLLVKWDKTSENRFLYLSALVFGLALANHYPLTLLALPGFLALILLNYERLNIRDAGCVLFFLLAALLAYAYLMIRASKKPPIDWGDPAGIRSFLDHVLRRQYRLLEMGKHITITEKSRFMLEYFKTLCGDFKFLLGFTLIGAALNFTQNKKYFLSFLVVFLFNTLVLMLTLQFSFNPERLSIISVYYVPSYIVIALWTVFGIDFVFSMLNRRFVREGFALTVVLLMSVNFSFALSANFRRYDFMEYNYCRNILKSVSPGSTLFILEAGDESLFGLLYENVVEGVRRDLRIYDCWGNVFENIYGKGFSVITDKGKWLSIRKDAEEKIVKECAGDVYYLMFSDNNYVLDRKLEPAGLLEKIAGSAGNKVYDMREFYDLSDICNSGRMEYQEKEIAGVYLLFLGKRDFNTNKNADMYFKKAASLAGDVPWVLNDIGLEYYNSKDYQNAENYFKQELPAYPDYYSAWYNLGFVYRDTGKEDEALRCFRNAAKYNPSDISALKESADLFWKKGFRENAALIYGKALAGNAAFADEYLFRGGEYYKSGQYLKAVDEWQKAALIKPDYALVYYDIGVACLDLNDRAAAKKYLEKYLALDPKSSLSASVRAKLKEIGEK
jgi:tetratricopeptide (TPR) repeat protein